MAHVLVGEAGLLGDALGGQHVAQALARVGLGGKVPDLVEALAGEPSDVEIGQAEGDSEPLGQRALGQRAAFLYGRENLQLPLVLPLDGHRVQYMNIGPRRKSNYESAFRKAQNRRGFTSSRV